MIAIVTDLFGCTEAEYDNVVQVKSVGAETRLYLVDKREVSYKKDSYNIEIRA